MVVRVVTKDLENAKRLLARLTRRFGGGRVSLGSDGEVEVTTRGAQNGALVQTLEAVEEWLQETAAESAEVVVDGRSYTVEQPASARVGEKAAAAPRGR